MVPGNDPDERTPGQPAHDEEVFGPVAAIIAAEDEQDAIRIANASEFGLGSGVLTGDLARGRRIAADELEAGLSFVNENVRSDLRMPFGGVKHSGYGRECSEFGIREFTNIKSVHVKALEHAGWHGDRMTDSAVRTGGGAHGCRSTGWPSTFPGGE